MNIINLKENKEYLEEYVKLCLLEWGNYKDNDLSIEIVNEKVKKIFTTDKVISVLGLIDNGTMIGFISLFKYDLDERYDLSPWYATMYVKKEYRNKGYSKILNQAILEEASKLGYSKVYLKTNLINYYEKFGAIYLDKLDNYEKIYYFELDNKKD